jgi:hypothetical protein
MEIFDSMLPVGGESDEGVVTGSRSRVLKVAGVVSAILVLPAMVAVAWRGSLGAPLAGASVEQSVEFTAADVQTNQPLWQINLKERDLCADTKDDCLDSGCCKVSGYHCLRTSASTGKCSKYCPKGMICTVVSQKMTFDVKEHTSMFCFSVYTQNTGSTKKSYDKELLEHQ